MPRIIPFSETRRIFGNRVICDTSALQVAVIPAKAGIQFRNPRKNAVDRLDSRFRGNDWYFERDLIPNEANTGYSGSEPSGGVTPTVRP
jgi:hypothetical protein